MGDGIGLGRLWKALGDEEEHPLAKMVNKRVADLVVRVFDGPRSRFGAQYFRVHLEHPDGTLCREPVLIGLCGKGQHPSQNWIEVAGVSRTASFEGKGQLDVDPENTDVGLQIWRMLADSIPAGGHLMVEYESPEWTETARALGQGVPPVATALGSLLFRLGCGVNFKDWYFSEGLHEGPRKLQGCKALDEGHQRRRAGEMARELIAYLAASEESEPHGKARVRAAEVLRLLPLSAREA